MNRRDFLRKAALLAAGVVAADQLELLERLTHKRRVFPGAGFGPTQSPVLNEAVWHHIAILSPDGHVRWQGDARQLGAPLTVPAAVNLQPDDAIHVIATRCNMEMLVRGWS